MYFEKTLNILEEKIIQNVVPEGRNCSIELVLTFNTDRQFNQFCKDIVSDMSKYEGHRTIKLQFNSSVKNNVIKCLHKISKLIDKYEVGIMDVGFNATTKIPDQDKELVILEVVGVYGSNFPIENSRREKPINLVAKG